MELEHVPPTYRFKFSFHAFCLSAALTGPVTLTAAAAAAPEFTNTARQEPYLGINSTIRGDIRNLGMSGAVVGLGINLFGFSENPASLAMTGTGLGLQFSSNRVEDVYIQPATLPQLSFNSAFSRASYPWGMGITFTRSFSEGGLYLLPGGTSPTNIAITYDEVKLSIARSLMDRRLSVGLAAIIGRGNWALGADERFSYTVSLQPGFMYQLPRRWLVGGSLSLPASVSPSNSPTGTPFDSFFQPIFLPMRWGLGIGWIPSRFFQFGASLHSALGAAETASLFDRTKRGGANVWFQPRVGMSYRWADFNDFKSTINTGMYLETNRLDAMPTRLHFTMGLEVDPWIFFLGVAGDFSADYANKMILVGIDIVYIASKLELIPKIRPLNRAEFFPNPLQYNDEGLARPLATNWRGSGAPDLIQVVEELPQRLEKRVIQTGETLINALENLDDGSDDFEEKPAKPVRKLEKPKSSRTRKPKVPKRP